MRSRIAAPSRSHRSTRSTLCRCSQSCPSTRTAFGADVVRDERHVIALSAQLASGSGRVALELACLRPRKPTSGEQPRVAAIRDHDLRLALRVPAQPRDDSELEQEQLHVPRQAARCTSSRRSGSCCAAGAMTNRRPEERLEKDALEGLRATARRAPEPAFHGSRWPASAASGLPEERVELLDVQLPDHCCPTRSFDS